MSSELSSLRVLFDFALIPWAIFSFYRVVHAWRKIREIADYHECTWWGAVRMIAEDTQSKADTNGMFPVRILAAIIFIAVLIYLIVSH
ncbi:MAG: hypothetical protein IJH68_00570 [Thermoguttaceae bacterium]|nr:hypothetical protein [Thermoguttaceae bacterium]MBR2585007.1 hypothetical protein [Thermoguttaceae bacterium]